VIFLRISWTPSVNFPWNWAYFQKHPVKPRFFVRESGWSLVINYPVIFTTCSIWLSASVYSVSPCVLSYWPTTSRPFQGRSELAWGPWARQANGAPMGRGFKGGCHSYLYQRIRQCTVRSSQGQTCQIASKLAFIKIIFDILGVSLDGGRNATKMELNCQNLSACTKTDLSCYLACENYAVGCTYFTGWKDNMWAVWAPLGLGGLLDKAVLDLVTCSLVACVSQCRNVVGCS